MLYSSHSPGKYPSLHVPDMLVGCCVQAYLRTSPGSEQSSRAIMGGKPSAATSSEAASSDLASLPRALMAPFFVASA